MTALRCRPARVLPFHGDRLAADCGRACLDEWAAFIAGDDGAGNRSDALDRLAALTDYYAQRAALEVLHMTGWTVPAWNVAENRQAIRQGLAAATANNPTTMEESALSLVMRESRRPFTIYEQKRSAEG